MIYLIYIGRVGGFFKFGAKKENLMQMMMMMFSGMENRIKDQLIFKLRGGHSQLKYISIIEKKNHLRRSVVFVMVM